MSAWRTDARAELRAPLSARADARDDSSRQFSSHCHRLSHACRPCRFLGIHPFSFSSYTSSETICFVRWRFRSLPASKHTKMKKSNPCCLFAILWFKFLKKPHLGALTRMLYPDENVPWSPAGSQTTISIQCNSRRSPLVVFFTSQRSPITPSGS